MSDNLKPKLLKTPLYDLHCKLGAKMVTFADYKLPVHFPGGSLSEHQHTRQQAGLFDVSHMGQIVVKGETAATELEKLLPIDLDSLPINGQRYALLTNKTGGVRDDLTICRWGENEFFLVVNAAVKAQDLRYLKTRLGGANRVEMLNDQALLALQGPASVEVLAQLEPATAKLDFMTGMHCEIDGVSCYISRSGYTGEDGFEISLPAAKADVFARDLLCFEQIEAIGLGARDSLRLEAGLCLYGHELDKNITPIEAGLAWTIPASRRAGGEKAGNFPGSDRILQQISGGTFRKRVALRSDERAPIRANTALVGEDGSKAGVVCSGGFSPVLETAIAMAYVETEYAKIGTRLEADVRGKLRPVTVVELPFVAHRYYQ